MTKCVTKALTGKQCLCSHEPKHKTQTASLSLCRLSIFLFANNSSTVFQAELQLLRGLKMPCVCLHANRSSSLWMWPLDLWVRDWELPVEWPTLESTLTEPGNMHSVPVRHTNWKVSCRGGTMTAGAQHANMHLHTLRQAVRKYAWQTWHFHQEALDQTLIADRPGLHWHFGSYSVLLYIWHHNQTYNSYRMRSKGEIKCWKTAVMQMNASFQTQQNKGCLIILLSRLFYVLYCIV